MRSRTDACLACSLYVLLAAPAALADTVPAATGDDATVRPPAGEPETLPGSQITTPHLAHDGQFGIAAAPGVGYRVIFPYGENIDCGQAGKRVCTNKLPVFIDLQASYGLTTSWDMLVDFRIGLEQDFTSSRQFAVAPGFRYWIDPKLRVKLFATLQAVLDDTSQKSGSVKDLDIGVRNANGLMFEVMRNLGLYLQLGETLGFRRWLRFEVDAAVGAQMRLP